MKTVKEFIGTRVEYDEGSGFIHGYNDKEECQVVCEVRGYGAIQNLFKGSNGTVDCTKANEFQDELGKFIAESINKNLNGK